MFNTGSNQFCYNDVFNRIKYFKQDLTLHLTLRSYSIRTFVQYHVNFKTLRNRLKFKTVLSLYGRETELSVFGA